MKESKQKVGYVATPAELIGIDRGLKAADEGHFATDEEVEAIIAKHRPRTPPAC